MSEKALEQASQTLAGNESLDVTFTLDDITESGFQDDQFDLILDRGCYHSICCFAHKEYIGNVKRVLKPSGILLLKTMSSDERRFMSFDNVGNRNVPMPYHFEKQELIDLFKNDFEVLEVRQSFFFSSVISPPAQARFAIMKNSVQ